MLKEGRRSGQHIAIGVADVDYFKQITPKPSHHASHVILQPAYSG